MAPCVGQAVARDLGVLGWIREVRRLQGRWRGHLYAFLKEMFFWTNSPSDLGWDSPAKLIVQLPVLGRPYSLSRGQGDQS